MKRRKSGKRGWKRSEKIVIKREGGKGGKGGKGKEGGGEGSDGKVGKDEVGEVK